MTFTYSHGHSVMKQSKFMQQVIVKREDCELDHVSWQMGIVGALAVLFKLALLHWYARVGCPCGVKEQKYFKPWNAILLNIVWKLHFVREGSVYVLGVVVCWGATVEVQCSVEGGKCGRATKKLEWQTLMWSVLDWHEAAWFLISMSNIEIYVIRHNYSSVWLAILSGKSINAGHCTQDFQPSVYGHYWLLPFCTTFTDLDLDWGHKVSTKQNLLASFSHTLYNWSGWN